MHQVSKRGRIACVGGHACCFQTFFAPPESHIAICHRPMRASAALALWLGRWRFAGCASVSPHRREMRRPRLRLCPLVRAG
eukprot:4241059-Pleurochrysis_carterae.AAC.1